ncbi:hypothetical protein Thiowin_04720 [Thiorhodovibrio winogradskyi]|uniref:DUF4340 domain-containing protein n=1 Tax=Thiorhodovibrio winogradskyi TaxID=77007 RepID=A0ABZ0SEU5_9GAMM|nr:hypothetical protein [Thiorhodovibrio winogradskyi]
MSGRWLINGLLLTLCTLLFLLARGQPESPPGLAGLIGFAPEQVTRIQLRQRGEAPLSFELSSDGWVMRDPVQGKVTAIMSERLDALVRAPAAVVFKPPMAVDQAAGDEAAEHQVSMLADMGLADPWLTLELNDLRLRAGAAEPIDRRRYLLAGDAVLLIDDRWLLPLLAAPADYLADDFSAAEPPAAPAVF